MNARGVIDHDRVQARMASTAPLELIEELRDASDVEGVYLRAVAYSEICDSKAMLRDLRRAVALAPTDRWATEWLRRCEASTRQDKLRLANELWDGASNDRDGWRLRRAAAKLALTATHHGSLNHRRAAERLEMASRQSLSADPLSISASKDLALAQGELGDVNGARATLDGLVDSDGFPPLPSLWSVDAFVARRSRDWNRARESWIRSQRLMGHRTSALRFLWWRYRSVLSIIPPAVVIIGTFAMNPQTVVLAGIAWVAIYLLGAWVDRTPIKRLLLCLAFVVAAVAYGFFVVALWSTQSNSPAGWSYEEPASQEVLDARHLDDEVVRFVKALAVGDKVTVSAMAGWDAAEMADMQGYLSGWTVSGVVPGERCRYFTGLQPEVDVPGFTHQNAHIAQRCVVVRLSDGPLGGTARVEVDLVFTLRGWTLSGGLEVGSVS